MSHEFTPAKGRGFLRVTPSFINPDERFAVHAGGLGVGSKGLVELGQWLTKVGREIAKQEKADAKAAAEEHLRTKAGIAAAHAIASLNTGREA